MPLQFNSEFFQTPHFIPSWKYTDKTMGATWSDQAGSDSAEQVSRAFESFDLLHGAKTVSFNDEQTWIHDMDVLSHVEVDPDRMGSWYEKARVRMSTSSIS